jgi:hypothetical protein
LHSIYERNVAKILGLEFAEIWCTFIQDHSQMKGWGSQYSKSLNHCVLIKPLNPRYKEGAPI